MGYEISYSGATSPRDAEILAVLRRDYPDKEFGVHNGTIIESYRTQPDFKTMLEKSPWYRARTIATRAVAASGAESADDYIGRVMSSDV